MPTGTRQDNYQFGRMTAPGAPMTPAIFERLLYEEESTTLDFKRDQYRADASLLLQDTVGP